LAFVPWTCPLVGDQYIACMVHMRASTLSMSCVAREQPLTDARLWPGAENRASVTKLTVV
jgi:hypothetical protein